MIDASFVQTANGANDPAGKVYETGPRVAVPPLLIIGWDVRLSPVMSSALLCLKFNGYSVRIPSVILPREHLLKLLPGHHTTRG